MLISDWSSDVCSSDLIDLRDNDTLAQLEATLAGYRPGKTPLRLLATTAAGCGVIEVNGAHRLRSEPELIDLLRALPGISDVRLHLQIGRATLRERVCPYV